MKGLRFYCVSCGSDVTDQVSKRQDSGDMIDCLVCEEPHEIISEEDKFSITREAYYDDLTTERRLEM